MFTRFVVQPGAPQWQWVLAVIGDFLIFGGGLFFLLQLVPNRGRKPLIIALTFLAGLIYSVEFFIPADPDTRENCMTNFITQVGQATNVVYAFALGLGVTNLIRFHGQNLLRLKPGWYNNLAFFVAFITMIFIGFWQYASPSSISNNAFQIAFMGVLASLGATMFSTIGFFIISAAYRAFRIRSGEATLMLITAFIVMVGQVPMGSSLTSGLPASGLWSSFRFENLSYWILNEPNMAAQRAMYFGIEVGALAMALRTWLSLERGSFFDREL